MWSMTAKGKDGNNGTTDYQGTTGEHRNWKTTSLQRSAADVSRRRKWPLNLKTGRKKRSETKMNRTTGPTSA